MLMKILMLGWEFPPLKSGGLGTYLFHFTRELHSLGVSLSFIMPCVGKDLKQDFINILQAGPASEIIGIRSTLTPYAVSLPDGTLQLQVQFAGLEFMQEVRAYTVNAVRIGKDISCDAIHCHDWMTFPAGIILKRILKKPLVVTIHSTEFDRTGQLFPNQQIAGIEKKGLVEADRIITVSKLMKNQIIEKYGISPEKIRVVYNAVDLSHYKRKEVQKPLAEKIVLFVGRLTIQKGCEFFLEAAKRVLEEEPNTRFVIVGTGDLLFDLINKSIELGISNKVTFTGYEEDVSAYYSIADLFVMPSVSEPFGLTAVEAMACKAPVLISRQSGVSEVLRNVLKVDFWDTRELAAKIVSVLKYSSLMEELRERGFNEIQQFRSWRDVASETIRVYRDVIG